MKIAEYEDLVQELKDEDEDNLTVKRQKYILNLISGRVDIIWRNICILADADLQWYSFSNDEQAFNNDGSGSDGGYFNPFKYEDDIELIGEWDRAPLYCYESGFPTRFLWTKNKEWNEEVLEKLEDYEAKLTAKQAAKKKSALKSKKKKALLDKIKKLSIEELEEVLANYQL